MRGLRRLFSKSEHAVRALTPQQAFQEINRFHHVGGKDLTVLVRKAAIFAAGSGALEHDLLLSLETYQHSDAAIRLAKDELREARYFDIDSEELNRIFSDVIGGPFFTSARWQHYHPQLLVWTAQSATNAVNSLTGTNQRPQRIAQLEHQAERLRRLIAQTEPDTQKGRR